jgi:hypothetical protein
LSQTILISRAQFRWRISTNLLSSSSFTGIEAGGFAGLPLQIHSSVLWMVV